MKLVLAGRAGIADPRVLIERQRGEYLQALRDLDRLPGGDERGRGAVAAHRGRGAAPGGRPEMARAVRGATDRGGHAMEHVLVTTGLERTYETDGVAVAALRGVDLAVAEGEFVSVMGPSGCGKSTLLHLLGGLDRPDRRRGPPRRAPGRPAQRGGLGAAAPPPGRLRLPVLQPDRQPHGRRQRRAARPARRAVAARGARAPARAARRPRHRGAGRLGPQPRVRRPAAARRHRARAHQPPGGAAGRRADRQPRQPEHARGPRAPAPPPRARPDDRPRHPRRARGERRRSRDPHARRR